MELLKVDVEGSEADVLAGVAAADWARIKQVAVEVHGAELRAQVSIFKILFYFKGALCA